MSVGRCGARALAGAWRTAAQRQRWGGTGGGTAGAAVAGGAGHARGFGLYDEMLAMAGRMNTAQASRRRVPDSIVAPDYALTGTPSAKLPKAAWMIEQHSDEDIELARVAGRVSREVLDEAGRAVAAGVTTEEIDRIVHEATIKRGAYPSPLNYHGFPRSVCTSINEVVCHGIPEKRTLREGDILNIDVSCYIGGFHGDNSEMFCVGEVDDAAKKLIQVTYDCWMAAINICKPGVPYSAIGGVIEDYVTAHGLSTTRNYCGHGVGRVFHTTPNVVHYKNNQLLGTMQPGHIFTIEPMINEGTHENKVLEDGWTVVTLDGKRSAQFEHTLLITDTGVEMLTGKLPNSIKQFWDKQL